VRYVEVRSMDVNAFEPLGVSAEQLHFMSAFTLFCLLADSPRISPQERRAIDENQVLAAHRGRDPKLLLDRDGTPIRLRDWALELLETMRGAADLVDGASGGPSAASLGLQWEKVREPDLTPSARMLAEMRANREGFHAFARRVSEGHRDTFRGLPLSPEREALFERLSEESRRRQAEIEAADDIDFDTFLARYFAQREPPGPEPFIRGQDWAEVEGAGGGEESKAPSRQLIAWVGLYAERRAVGAPCPSLWGRVGVGETVMATATIIARGGAGAMTVRPTSGPPRRAPRRTEVRPTPREPSPLGARRSVASFDQNER
jgi:hypothetical protein